MKKRQTQDTHTRYTSGMADVLCALMIHQQSEKTGVFYIAEHGGHSWSSIHRRSLEQNCLWLSSSGRRKL